MEHTAGMAAPPECQPVWCAPYASAIPLTGRKSAPFLPDCLESLQPYLSVSVLTLDNCWGTGVSNGPSHFLERLTNSAMGHQVQGLV